jgi:hypothetical protein
VKNGSSFSALIKKSENKTVSYGNGNNSTIEGVEFMADLINKSSHQVKTLAKKLKRNTLKETIASIHSFLTTYIQYKADDRLQNLYSPSSAWANRKEGVDCKSFTIFAVALLKEMGYSSIIRQVKQPQFYSDQFTHVYVVVPKNQQSKAVKSPDSYFVLDGTILNKFQS